jgi:FkbM family methyltransferase
MSVKVANCRHGSQVYLDSDIYFGPLIERCGEYNEGEVDLFRHLIGEGSVVIDAGANIGCHTVPLGKIVGPTGMVLAFEPQRPIYYALCGTLALNELWHVTAYPVALGSERGTTKVAAINYSKPANYGGASIGNELHGHDVPVVRLDDFELPSLRFIKADVEGHETELLMGARETIRRHRPILYVENDRIENSDRLIDTMLGLEYRLYLHAPPLFSPNNFRGCDKNLFPNVVSVMLLGIPAEASTSFSIHGMRPIARPEDMVKFGHLVI